MIYFVLMVFAFAESFLLWVLVALVRESPQLASRTEKADLTGRGPANRRGKPIPMNPGTTQNENAGKATGRHTLPIAPRPSSQVLMVMKR